MLFAPLTFSEIINGCTVKVAFNFNKYKKRHFLVDLADVQKVFTKYYPTAESIPEDIRDSVQLTMLYEMPYNAQIYALTRKGMTFDINYDYFQKTGASLLVRLLFYVLSQKEYKPITENKEEIDITITIITGITEGTYAQFNFDNSTENTIALDFSGSLMLGRICGPWFFLQKIDSSFLLKTLMHELQHVLEFSRKVYDYEVRVVAKATEFMKENPRKIAAFPVLYEIFPALYTEGIASFQEKQNAAKITLDLTLIETAKTQIDLISKTRSKKKALEIYYSETDSEGGAYYLGYMMCVVIGFAVAKSKKYPVMINFPTKGQIEWEQLAGFINKHQKVVFAQFDSAIITQTYAQLKTIRHFDEFVKLFEKSCDYLDFKPPVRFISKKWVSEIFKNVKRKA